MENSLYNKLIKNISESIKQALDETLTTFPYNKIQRYLLTLVKKYEIMIFPYLGKNPINIVDLNESTFDDIQLYIVPKNYKELSDIQLSMLTNDIQLTGYFYSKTCYGTIPGTYIDSIYYIFSPNKQNSIKINSKYLKDYIYHLCPLSIANKIKQIGFVSKSKNPLFKYDPRIHFFYSNTLIIEIKRLLHQFNEISEKPYCLLTIDIKKLHGIRFYKDIDEEFGIYTKDNIPPNCIINEIVLKDDFDVISYFNYKLNNTANNG